MRVPLSLIILLSIVTAVNFAVAAVIHVPGDQPTIQAGLDAAAPGDEVVVACGTYYERDILLSSGVILRSETGEPGCVTVDAKNLGRGFSAISLAETATVEGLTVTGGRITDNSEGGGGCTASPAISRSATAYSPATTPPIAAGASRSLPRWARSETAFSRRTKATMGAAAGSIAATLTSLSQTASSPTTSASMGPVSS
jgi:hypothetical protein